MTGAGEKLFVVTGGPGSGKTTLLTALQAHGYCIADEAGRLVIREQLAASGDALPWADREAFARAMTAHDVRSYRAALAHRGITLFDRGIPDVIGYLKLEGLPVPAELTDLAESLRYNRRIFIAPPWREIYAQDSERRQTFDVAERTFAAMIQTYRDLDYELIELPRSPIEERVAFVRKQLEA